jgi:hypothetical protein
MKQSAPPRRPQPLVVKDVPQATILNTLLLLRNQGVIDAHTKFSLRTLRKVVEEVFGDFLNRQGVSIEEFPIVFQAAIQAAVKAEVLTINKEVIRIDFGFNDRVSGEIRRHLNDTHLDLMLEKSNEAVRVFNSTE